MPRLNTSPGIFIGHFISMLLLMSISENRLVSSVVPATLVPGRQLP